LPATRQLPLSKHSGTVLAWMMLLDFFCAIAGRHKVESGGGISLYPVADLDLFSS
jgi:hypothetical protein